MKKIFIFTIYCILCLPFILADLSIEKNVTKDVIILNINESIETELTITNFGESENFEIYNLLGFEINPNKINIDKSETKTINLKITPIGEFNHQGSYTLTYFIKGKNNENQQKITFRSTDLANAFEIGIGEINSKSNYTNFYIHNRINYEFKKLKIKINSPFFEFEENFNLGPNKRKDFEIDLNNKNFKNLPAGFYTATVEISLENEKTEIEKTLKFNEKNSLQTTNKNYGILINTQIIEKINDGNLIANPIITLEKNIFTKIFTNFSPEPDIIKRIDSKIIYTWNPKINPGETLKITIKTNWLIPIISIFFIITLIILIKKYTKTGLIMKKKVSFVKTKGGEFALKISIIIKALDYIEKINIIDKLPPFVKIHERFGGEYPHRIDEKNKRIEWSFDKLEKGENRIISYIIYSKLGVLGKFALPSATAIYEQEGKINDCISNRAFFVSEKKKKKRNI